MLYESRKILLGFRIKLNFDAPLNKENSYIFVNLSKTPTIRDLLDSIKDRFEISQDVYVALNDCRLLNSEDSAVLIDVNEVRIVPCKNEKNVAASKTSQEFITLVSDVSSKINSLAQTDTKCEINDELTGKNKQLSTPVAQLGNNEATNKDILRKNEIPERKCRRFYSSIAETIKYLHQNHNPVSESAPALSDSVTSSECKNGNESNSKGVKERENVPNGEELSCENNASFEEASNELVEKRKRKRKRKHSKKPKLEYDQSEITQTHQDVCSTVNTDVVDSSSSKTARKHIFFDGNDDQSVEFEEQPNEYDLSSNASYSTSLVNVKAEKCENGDVNVEDDVMDESSMDDVTDGSCLEMAKREKFEKKQPLTDVSEPSWNSFKQIPKSRFDKTGFESIDIKYSPRCEKSIRPYSTPSSNDGFFSTFQSMTNSRSNVRTKEIASEGSHPLATLLMCKQLQTPVEYNVQFTRFNGVSHNQSNVSRTPRENNKTKASSSIINRKSSTRFDNGTAVDGDEQCEMSQQYKVIGDKVSLRDSNGRRNSLSVIDQNPSIRFENGATAAPVDVADECEVLRQCKIVGDKVSLRDSNGMWNTLTEEEASLKLQPVDEPRENQSITFQILYLGPDMCPSVSNLICGKVISFQKESERLTLTILPAFLDKLVKCDEEGVVSLPDELVHVTENVYQISWFAVKNPRLLM